MAAATVSGQPVNHWLTLEQTSFVLAYAKQHPAPRPLTRPEQFDAYYDSMCSSWSERTERGIDSLLPLSPYSFVWSLPQLFGDGVPFWAQGRLFTRFAIPAYLEYYRQFRKTDNPMNAYILRVSDMAGVCGSSTLNCDLSPSTLQSLVDDLSGMPAVIREYLHSPKLSDTIELRELQRVDSRVTPFLSALKVRSAIVMNQPDTAFYHLNQLIQEKRSAVIILPLADDLWHFYLGTEQPAKARAVIDLLARSLTVVDLPDDSLRLRYLTADPKGGEDYFDRTAKALRPPTLVPSIQLADLRGAYKDLRTGETLNLNTLKGKLVVLDFWTTWCHFCLEDIRFFKALLDRVGHRFVLVSVCSDGLLKSADYATAAKFVKDHDITYPALWDDSSRSLTERFLGTSLRFPSKFLIDPSGVLLVHPRESDRNYVELEEIEAYLAFRR